MRSSSNWDEEKVERQSVMIPKETPPQQQQEEGTDQAEMERRSQQAPGSPRRPPSSEEIEEETPPRRTKLLSDIYETCNFIMLEPENFETAVKHKVWASKKQATVAQSSAEAEYIAAAATSNQAIWLRRILEDIGEKQEEPTTIYCDNKSAIAITKIRCSIVELSISTSSITLCEKQLPEERLNSSTAVGQELSNNSKGDE
ncbi:UNVERIFIED_CONTAM: hypothetical protein Scaly_2302800 [Sesamum calycinum]|uniref:Uncharacterized protein n=1 Tax=Sesamum calycinum TaxID=2727403 RepID=A0AAW2MBT1_9LAMI